MKYNLYNYDDKNRDLILCILQISTLYNVMNRGWNIKRIDSRTYEISKKICELDNFDFNIFIKEVTNIKYIKC